MSDRNPSDQTDGGEVWGPLSRDTEALEAALVEVNDALGRAAQAALWRTRDGFPIHSPLSDTLGALSTVVDGILSERAERAGV